MSRTINKREHQRLERLEMRWRYLNKQIKQAEEMGRKLPGFIPAEASALRWAIDLIKEHLRKDLAE